MTYKGIGECHAITLTQGLDTITGTSGNDTINAYAFNSVTGADVTTLNSVDSIDGGAGTDTLNIEVKADGAVEDFNGVIQGTIKNVEIININNTDANSAANVDASKLGAEATQIWQIGGEGDVSKLLATTTAGFRGETNGTLNVAAAAAAATVTVALDAAADADLANGNDIILNASGVDLNAVTVTGTLAAGTNDPATQTLTINVEAGVDEQTVTVNTAIDATVTVTENDATAVAKPVNTLNAAGSTGAITFAGDTDVLSVTTAGGDDDVTLSYSATANNKTASVVTGAGDDTIVVTASANAKTGFAVTVDAGAGNDDITINAVATTVTAGAGDDIVHVTTSAEGDYRALTDSDILNGGDGNDTIVIGAASPVLDSGDYVRLQDLNSFEYLQFEDTVGTGTAVDAAELGNFTKIIFNGAASFVENVSAAQAIVSGNGDLTATTAGYDDAATDTNNAAAALNITSLATGTLDLFAKSAALTVDAAAAKANVTATVTGDLDTAAVTLTSGVNAAGDTDYVAAVTVNVTTENPTLTSLTISGTGSANVTGGGKLVTINTAGLAGTDVDGAAFDGLTFVGALANKEAVTVGAGIDDITIKSQAGSSSLTKMDTITGLSLSLNDAGTDFAATSDTFTLNLAGLTTTATEFVTKTFATAPASIGAALNTVSAMTDNAVVFQFDGATYLFIEDEAGTAANGNFEATDLVVKLAGTYDLADLAVMANLSFPAP